MNEEKTIQDAERMSTIYIDIYISTARPMTDIYQFCIQDHRCVQATPLVAPTEDILESFCPCLMPPAASLGYSPILAPRTN